MNEKNLDCCVVRDLLPSYIEELTEEETSALVKSHLERCSQCRAREDDMRVQLPAEKAPKRALRFLKRVKRTRLIAAILTAVVALLVMWLIYDKEFHYANTDAGRLAAVCDYIPYPEDWPVSYGVKEGTPLQVISWVTKENRLFIFFKADNEEHVHGVMHLVRGINGKYRAIESTYSPSQYTAGVYGKSLTPSGTDWELFMLGGDNCRDIYSAEIQFIYYSYDGERSYTAEKTYSLSEANFLWLMEEEEIKQALGIEGKEITDLHINDVRLLDKNGEDITGQYKDETMTTSWGSGKGTAELFLLYMEMATLALLAIMAIRSFLRRE